MGKKKRKGKEKISRVGGYFRHPQSPKIILRKNTKKTISCTCPLTCFQESSVLFGTCRRSGLWSRVVCML